MDCHAYAIPILGRWLIYSPAHAFAALVNGALREAFNQGSQHAAVTKLRQALTAEPLQEIPHRDRGALNPAFLGLLPTRACNMGCVYCDFHAHTEGHAAMDPNLAVAAIDWMADIVTERGGERLEVHFFGGEPFVAGEVVDVALHRTRQVGVQRNLIPNFKVSTNGYCSAQRAQFIGHHFDGVVLSFDGTKELHDRNRPVTETQGSFETVCRSADILGRSPTELCFRMCVTAESVDQMVPVTQWFCHRFHPAMINFEPLKANRLSQQGGLAAPDPYRFAREYLRAAAAARAAGVQPVYSAACRDELRLSFCPLGKDALIVDSSGEISACYLMKTDWEARGLDLTLGTIGTDNKAHLDMGRVMAMRKLVVDKARCGTCFCRWSCAGGCHVGETYPGSPTDYTPFCIHTRLITACEILQDLGQGDLGERLMASPEAMEALALFSDDRMAVMADGAYHGGA